MEGAYDDWKRGEWSRNPYVDMCIPSKSDPTMAAPENITSVFIQYVPFNLATVDGMKKESKNLEDILLIVLLSFLLILKI